MMNKLTPFLMTAGIAIASLYVWNKLVAPMLSSATPNPYVI